MTGQMNTMMVERAMRRLGEVLAGDVDIELLLVGGAAGMLTGLLSRDRVTTDCDVMVVVPEEATIRLELAAVTVGAELGLSPSWLNSEVQIRVDALPDGWRERRVSVGTFGPVRVYAVSRPDLIAMKVLAGRDQDIEDVLAMRPRSDDVEFVLRYLDALSRGGSSPRQIEEARRLLDVLEVRDHD